MSKVSSTPLFDSPDSIYYDCRTLNHIAWAEQEGLLAGLLPFNENDFDPVETLLAIRTVIEDTIHTTPNIYVTDVTEITGDSPSGLVSNLEPLFEYHGSWQRAPENQKETGPTRFVNPTYIHLDSLPETDYDTDEETRVEVSRRLVRFGMVTQDYLATRFNMSERSVQRLLKRNDIPWVEWKREGLTRLAKTVETIHKWGYQYQTIAEAFDMSERRLRTFRSDYVPNDWEPPADPTA